jgi:hypothetical protein
MVLDWRKARMFWVYVSIALAGALVIRVLLHFHDKQRILASASGNGWQDVSITWDPFAPGWFFEGQERHYAVSYVDEKGARCGRYCKLRFFGAIYWKDPDSIELPSPPDLQA